MVYLTTHTSLSPIRRGFTPCFVNYKKGCTRLTVTSDKVYQLLAHGRWFSPGTPASSTTKTGCHDIAESGVKHQKSINHTSLSPIRRGFVPGFVNYKKGALDSQSKVYQLLAHGQWFSPCTPAYSTTKTGRHDIAEI